jgi:hypothetical protein
MYQEGSPPARFSLVCRAVPAYRDGDGAGGRRPNTGSTHTPRTLPPPFSLEAKVAARSGRSSAMAETLGAAAAGRRASRGPSVAARWAFFLTNLWHCVVCERVKRVKPRSQSVGRVSRVVREGRKRGGEGGGGRAGASARTAAGLQRPIIPSRALAGIWRRILDPPQHERERDNNLQSDSVQPTPRMPVSML